MNGRVNSIQTLGTLDGPGVRFVLFMQGCPLRCAYCHNPDTWDFSAGEEYSPEEIIEKVKRYKSYYGKNGGITVSGGEPLAQADFVRELFYLCRENRIHTCLDTSGGLWSEKISGLLDLTDLCLLDLKMTNQADYKKYTGWDMQSVVYFLDRLTEKNIPAWIRQVIVSGINDNEENIKRLKGLTEGRKNIGKIELLPFRKLCSVKYDSLGIEFPLKNYPETTKEQIERLSTFLL